ncbi:MAG: transposase [Sulfuricurvum sp.]|uniref:transposase n=1 Tax=Sulfuricurvum sp. TaxID=2025608 RepID=UPI0026124CB8|nr:transposase [Sulfuricurvum sp.]MDD2830002.1 transposase [Sulfuricurvum sp.]MDD4948401.1 transposase [Sulfuricurvum sp.]
MNVTSHCIYCHHTLYHLSDGMVKCSVCKKKYSPQRIHQIKTLIKAFCDDENALLASKTLNLSYGSVLKYYQKFRHLCAEYCEEQYQLHRTSDTQYEEYLYIEKSKRHDKTAIFDSHNFLTFSYGEKVYTLLMPSLGMFKQQFVADNLEEVYYKEFSKFMRTSKIIKISEYDNVIEQFWHYFEEFITGFKGVSKEHFPYYLKEAEFKFNTHLKERPKILEQLYFHPID